MLQGTVINTVRFTSILIILADHGFQVLPSESVGVISEHEKLS